MLKKFLEQRSAALARMKELTESLKNGDEVRAFTDEELSEFNKLKSEAESLNTTIAALEEQRAAELDSAGLVSAENRTSEADDDNTRVQREERAFVNYLRTGAAMGVESRADSYFTFEANGATVPASIANKIIDKVKELSPLFSLATHYNIGGVLNIPYYDETTGSITTTYADEFTDGEATSGKFLSITLTGFLARTLTKVSRRLMNNSQFDILNFVVNKVAEAIALWLDHELIVGTAGKIEGLQGVTQEITTSSAASITSDELIDLQDTIPDVYQANAVWIMSKSTRTKIRKLKDGEGNYLLNKDATAKWGYTLFGKPVYIADAMPDAAAGEVAIYYGDFNGLAIKTSESVNIQVLREQYAVQHAIGVVAWLELDSKVENAQKIAALRMKTT